MSGICNGDFSCFRRRMWHPDTGMVLGDHVVRVDPSEQAHHVWHLPCATEPLHDAKALFGDHRSPMVWREPPLSESCCRPPQGCYRAVIDDAVTLPEHSFHVGQSVEARHHTGHTTLHEWRRGVVTSVSPLLRVHLLSDQRGADSGRIFDDVRPLADAGAEHPPPASPPPREQTPWQRLHDTWSFMAGNSELTPPSTFDRSPPPLGYPWDLSLIHI